MAFGFPPSRGFPGGQAPQVGGLLSGPVNALSGLLGSYVPPTAQANILASQQAPQVNALRQQQAPQVPQANDPAYEAWKGRYGLTETPDYDLRGAYASGLKPDSRGHLDDTFKKPNHITFSTDSRYSTPQEQGGVWAQAANGKWTFTAGPANLKRYTPSSCRTTSASTNRTALWCCPRRTEVTALDRLFNWRPMSEVNINTPVMVRIGNLAYAATWTNGAWQIGKNLKLKTPPFCWTPIVPG